MQAILQMFVPMAIFVLVFYVLIIRPQKKQERQVVEMRENVSVGDEIITIGGIIGKVTRVKEDEITIEVGADKSKLNFKKFALREVTKSTKINTEVK